MRLSAFYAAYFAAVGVQLPFWPLWLASRGLDATEIGVVLAASVLAKPVSDPLFAHLADRRGARRPIMIGLAAAAVAAFSLFALARGFLPVLLVSLGFVVFWSALMPLGESLTIIVARARDLEYGRIRLWGSVTFIAAAVASGRIVAATGSAVVLPLIAAMVAATLIACLGLPGARVPPAAPSRLPVRRVLGIPPFGRFLAAAALIQGSHGVYYGFGTLHWRASGHSADVIGWLWAEGVVAEIALFAAGARLARRLGPAGLMVLGGAGAAVRWTVTALSADLPVLVVAQSLHALTFAAAHLGAIHFIARAVPASWSATAQSLYGATVGGIGIGLALAASGPLYAALGGHAYLVMAGLGAAGALVAAGLNTSRSRSVEPDAGVPPAC